MPLTRSGPTSSRLGWLEWSSIVDANSIADRASRWARDFGGIKVSALDGARLLEMVRDSIETNDQLSITFINPDYARRAFRDDTLRAHVNTFDLVLVDGNGVRWLAPLFGFRVEERLDTDSLAPRLLAELAAIEARVFLFGCAPGVAERAASHVASAYPELEVVGFEHGFWDVERGHPGRFDPEDSNRIVARIAASGADYVLVSLPTPLQQHWVNEHRRAIPAPVIMTGGSFLDHVAENERWPESWYPDWANRFSLNWFYRLLREPGRLWKRYTIELAQFVLLALRARFARRG